MYCLDDSMISELAITMLTITAEAGGQIALLICFATTRSHSRARCMTQR